ncbi:MAG: SHOCT domain-containing protein [Candidatus Delongbacteria bacterium]|nr:SHOCT domain-containing protein [Candidatus Delongbacteria bacterium]
MKYLTVILIISLNVLSAHTRGWMGDGMMHSSGFLYFILLTIILGIISIPLFKKNYFTRENNPPLEILNKRLAKGDITIEEYRKLKRSINN